MFVVPAWCRGSRTGRGMIVWLAATLWLFSAALAAELPKEHLPHHYSYYPCLPREPELHLTSAVGLLVPPSGPRFVERKFPAVAERTLMLHLYMLATGSPMRRLLWLFNRSWGALSNGTVLTVVWKDNEDLVHADRELNITGLDLIERWNHLTFRFWEKEGQVAVNGETVMRYHPFFSLSLCLSDSQLQGSLICGRGSISPVFFWAIRRQWRIQIRFTQTVFLRMFRTLTT